MDGTTTETFPLQTYAQPLSGLKVSWGAVLAGAVTTLAVSLIIWALCLAIVMTATNPTVHSIRGSFIALWVCGIGTTLIGALIGGGIAGYLPGNPRRLVSASHAFLAWGVAFLVASMLQFGALGGIIRAAGRTVAAATSTVVQTAGSVAAGAPSRPGGLEQRATEILQTLGYSPTEARQIVSQAQQQFQQTMRGTPYGQQPPPGGQPSPGASARGALDAIINGFVGFSWTWFGTWALAGLLAVLGGTLVTRRLRAAEGPEPAHARRARAPEVPQRTGVFIPTPSET